MRIGLIGDLDPAGLGVLPPDFTVGLNLAQPDALLVRSVPLTTDDIPDSVIAVARAGIGVDTIPVDALTRRGIPVFNAPGANANAVKELVIAGLLLAARHLPEAWEFVHGLDGDDEALTSAVEEGKHRFVGFEVRGKTLGVVGLGAVGVEVANSAIDLGMNVLGFDPGLSVARAWQLSSAVQQAASLEALFMDSDVISLHIPLTDETDSIVDASLLSLARDDAVLLNFARRRLVDEASLLDALRSGKLARYVTDFPAASTGRHPGVIALPHLGASTREARIASVGMAASTLRDYLLDGVIRHSVNFPDAVLASHRHHRIAVVNENVPGMVSRMATALADADLNIVELVNASHGDHAYTLIDVEGEVPPVTFEAIRMAEGVVRARLLRGRGVSTDPADTGTSN